MYVTYLIAVVFVFSSMRAETLNKNSFNGLLVAVNVRQNNPNRTSFIDQISNFVFGRFNNTLNATVSSDPTTSPRPSIFNPFRPTVTVSKFPPFVEFFAQKIQAQFSNYVHEDLSRPPTYDKPVYTLSPEDQQLFMINDQISTGNTLNNLETSSTSNKPEVTTTKNPTAVIIDTLDLIQENEDNVTNSNNNEDEDSEEIEEVLSQSNSNGSLIDEDSVVVVSANSNEDNLSVTVESNYENNEVSTKPNNVIIESLELVDEDEDSETNTTINLVHEDSKGNTTISLIDGHVLNAVDGASIGVGEVVPKPNENTFEINGDKVVLIGFSNLNKQNISGSSERIQTQSKVPNESFELDDEDITSASGISMELENGEINNNKNEVNNEGDILGMVKPSVVVNGDLNILSLPQIIHLKNSKVKRNL